MRIPDSIRIIVDNILFNSIIGAKWFPRPLRPWAMRRAGISCGKSMLLADIFFDGKFIRKVHIGDGSVINNQVYIDASGDVTIGDRTGIASRVRILTATHDIGPHDQRMGDLTALPVSIGSGVWIGADTTILPGVTIADGVVIGAGSLVTKDCEPDAVYVGRPARLLRHLALDSGDAVDRPADGGAGETS